MKCKMCGKLLEEGQNVCDDCGTINKQLKKEDFDFFKSNEEIPIKVNFNSEEEKAIWLDDLKQKNLKSQRTRRIIRFFVIVFAGFIGLILLPLIGIIQLIGWNIVSP